VAIPFALVLGVGWKETLLLWPALSAAAIVIERLPGAPIPAQYIEDAPAPTEDADELLRQRQKADREPMDPT
jgi:hypothetical protein